MSTTEQNGQISRRGFMKTSAALGAGALASTARFAHAQGSDTIRVGLIGCGGRGTGAGIIDCANSSEGIELVAIGDLFEERVKTAPARIKGNLRRRKLDADAICKVTPETSFVGWDAYEKVIACDVDMVILTTPPYFRPAYFKAAVDAGKHVFAEKPIGVDPVQVRDFIATAEAAKSKGLCVVAGTQMRRARHIMKAMEKLHQGDLGDLISGQCVRCGGGMLDWGSDCAERKSEWSDIEYQIRRWLFMTWLSGDFITEMHVHNLDLLNWAMGSPPAQCMVFGGREVRKGAEYGNVYDHFAGEYLYPNGCRIEYIGSQIDGTSTRNDLRIDGSKGRALIDFGQTYFEGEAKWTYDGPSVQPAVQEYGDMIAAIRANEPINEGRQVAESTLTAIMGRESAYTGRAIKWDWIMKASKLKLGPEKMGFGDFEIRPVPVPGKTPLV